MRVLGALRTSSHRSRWPAGAEGRCPVRRRRLDEVVQDRIEVEVEKILGVALADVPDAVEALEVEFHKRSDISFLFPWPCFPRSVFSTLFS